MVKILKIQLTNECFELSKKNQDFIESERILKSELDKLNKEFDELRLSKDEISNSLDVLKNENSIMQSSLIGLKKVILIEI